ncbi:hypothetical protein [uncultured Proteiniphilum sp.]|jgi:hypothetical protein|uniref:hypothetical protein n=1 Tax=uncultured Proteiniphilum sp. TaxID=497637 RepID=UPI0026336E57|nr:hypothetical protein [uncultured Proteiniphilum sp.]
MEGVEMTMQSEYMTIQDAAKKWGITERRVQVLCASGRIEGARKFSRVWAIPSDMEKPSDARIKSGKYLKTTKADGENL